MLVEKWMLKWSNNINISKFFFTKAENKNSAFKNRFLLFNEEDGTECLMVFVSIKNNQQERFLNFSISLIYPYWNNFHINVFLHCG